MTGTSLIEASIGERPGSSLLERFATASAFAVLLLSLTAYAQQVTFSTVADSTLSIPGGTGMFQTFNPNLAGFPPNPCISGGIIAFWGGGSGGQQGIYVVFPPQTVFQPSPIKIADLATAIPGGSGDFLGFPPQPAISGANVAFTGNGSGQQGVYVGFPPTPAPSSPAKIADLNTAIPGGTGDFLSFPPQPAISGANVAFIGNGSGQQGVYVGFPPVPAFPSGPAKIADLNTVIPDTGGAFNFGLFPPTPTISGQNVAFIGRNGLAFAEFIEGVYIAVPGQPLAVVADFNTSVPGGGAGDHFDSFSSVALDGTSVAFVGTEHFSIDLTQIVQSGVYLSAPGNSGYPPSPVKIADLNTAVPGLSALNATFVAFGPVALDPRNVVFEAAVNLPVCNNPPGCSSITNITIQGIYGYIGGSLVKIVDQTDTPGGKTITALNFGPGGFSGNQAVYEIEFSDGTQSIMAATFNNFTRCPQSQGFWKNHTAWPVTTLVLGGQNYSVSQLLALLGTPTNSDASLMLARQLIAAKLNIASSSNPAPANAAIADADDLLATFAGKLPYNVKPSSTIGQRMENDANILQNYNANTLTPGCTH